MKLIDDFKRYNMSPWERTVMKFNLIVVPIMVILHICYYS